MKFSGGLVLLCNIHFTAAHYTFSTLSLNNGAPSSPWQYTRPIKPGWAYDPVNGFSHTANPYYDIYDDNIRCGRGAATSGPGTQTLTVNAGDELTFFSTRRNDADEVGSETSESIYHEGPGQAYLSRVENGDLAAYKGDGDWFKIGSLVEKDGNFSTWALLGMPSMSYSIPKTTPPGKYLMRVEHLYPLSSRFNDTQFYISCTHLEIQGPGGGIPGPMARFPGAYSVWDEAIWVPFRVSNDIKPNLTGYLGPGPALWTS